MSITAPDFRRYVIQPALAALAAAGIPATQTAADLLMATAAIESGLGTWLVQEGGPALGVFQIEPPSLDDLEMMLTAPQKAALGALGSSQPLIDQLAGNLVLAAAICRLFYWHIPDPLPADTVSGLWGYYKQHYNTSLGAATEAEFLMALKLTDLGSLPA
jgi:hypothetical protein